jgi:hypothetical protein
MPKALLFFSFREENFTTKFCYMKKILFFLLLTFTITSLEAQENKDQKAIKTLLFNQTHFWNEGNIDSFMNGYWHNDSLMFIGKSGVTYGFTNTLNNYKKNYSDKEKMGKLFFDILKIKKLSPEYYWVLGKWFLKRSIGDIGGHYTLLFRKIGSQWVIVADHSS